MNDRLRSLVRVIVVDEPMGEPREAHLVNHFDWLLFDLLLKDQGS